MPGLETDSVQQFDPLASSGSVNAVTVSEHSFSSSAPLASVTRPGFVHPVLSPSSVASHYPQVFSGRAPVLAYGLRWSHPVPGSVSVQPMVMMCYFDVFTAVVLKGWHIAGGSWCRPTRSCEATTKEIEPWRFRQFPVYVVK